MPFMNEETEVLDGINGNSTTLDYSHINGATPQSNGNVHTPETSIPVAICGMALRLPGGLSSPEEFWDFLLAKGDARGRVPSSRYNIDAYHNPNKGPGDIGTEYGYFLDESVKLGAFDASRFSLGKTELEFADPQQRRLLEVVQEALDEAGNTTYRGKPIGVYVGNMGEDWAEISIRDPLSHGANRIDGYNDWMLSNRISYEFGLQGPSMTIRTACSSAMIGLAEACAAMQRGICEGAIVAGSTLILAPTATQMMTEKGILGPDGSCKTFSADANGYARGEAITAIYVKPLDAAIRDGNPIRAVIRAAVANSDGRTQGITNPNPIMHEAAIRKAYELAKIKDFSQTGYFECHGTGTAVGDPLETGAVANVFGDHGIHITSVKPNVGHTEGASGIVSLIKAVMSLENRTIPPNIKFTTPNPKIPFKARKLTVPTEPTPWPAHKHERVSVNSFGLGGSNAHVIVDSAASFNIPERTRGVRNQDAPQLLLLSASSAPSIKRMVVNYDEWLSNNAGVSERLDDLAYTLANRREHLSHRAFKVRGGKNDISSTGKKIPSQAKNLVMVFTGQGAQWPQMGKELLARDDLVFRSTMEELDDHLQSLPENPPSWSIIKELSKSFKTSQVSKAHLSQPLCTAVQIGLIQMLSKIGVEPTAVVGHSSGELAAAFAAGALTAKEAIIGAYQRGQAAQLAKKGAMAAVAMPWVQVEKYLTAKCVVACENSPESVTLSGDIDEVQAVIERISRENPDTSAKLLRVEKAYHSSHMREIGQDYFALIKPHLKGRKAVKPFFSSVVGSGEPETRTLDAKYWQDNLENPVLFKSAVAGVLEHVSNPAFLEIGPHGALAGPARQIFAQASTSSPPPYLSVMTRNEDCVESFLKAAGQLFELNIPLDFEALTPSGNTLAGLPRYPWNHEGEELWKESRMSKEWRFPAYGKHPLLGRRQLECTSLEPSFRNLINTSDIPWLRDHKIQNNIVFPAAGYLAMAGEAIRQLTGVEGSYRLRNVTISQAMLLQDGVDTEVVANFRHHTSEAHDIDSWWEFTISSYSGSLWQKHCAGQVAANQTEPAPADKNLTSPLPRNLNKEKTFDILARAGMQYGPKFQLLDNISTGTTERKAVSRLGQEVNGDEAYYHLHPTVIDAALQAGLIAPHYGKINPNNSAAMPTFLENVSVFRCSPESIDAVIATARVDETSGDISGKFQCVAGDKIVLDIPVAQFSPVKWDETNSKHHFPITGRVEWAPLIDLLKPASLIQAPFARGDYEHLLREYSDLFIVLAQRKIEAATNFTDSLAIRHFVPWVDRQFKALPKDHPVLAMDNEAIVGRAYEITTQTADTPVAVITSCLLELGAVIDELLTGETNIEKVLATDDLMSKFFLIGNKMDRSAFVKSLAHSKPNLRVLEIGASTNGAIDLMLKELILPSGKPAYSKYTYSDVRPMTLCGPLTDAQQRLKAVPNMEFRVLDVSKDLASQGFDESDQYDLIMANNIVQETASIAESLSNVRKLLAPNGRLLLQELCTESKWVNCIWGFLDDWWFSAVDNRPDEPYMHPSEWSVHLERAGLTLQDTMYDAPRPDQWNAVMVITPQPVENKLATKAVTILSDDDVAAAGWLNQNLVEQGYKVDQRKLGDELPKDQDIISLLDEKAPFFENTTEARFMAFQQLLANLGQSALLWVTRPSQMYCNDPRYAQIIGMSRSVRSEEMLHFGTLEVDSLQASLGKVVDVFKYFQQRIAYEQLLPNYEFAISEGTVYVPRIYPFTLGQECVSSSCTDVQVALDVQKVGPGRVSSLQWKARDKKALSGDQVEVQVFAAGLTHRDAAKVTGRIRQSEPGLGVECSGIISRVGPAVTDLAIGDRVLCLGNGSVASYAITNESLCERMPKTLSFEEAASLPASYVVAKAALQSIGDLRFGQSILIHSACNGAGLVALQLARSTKADIYVTASSDEEINTLVNKYGLSRDRVFSSRTADFAEQILQQTDGQGVCSVLNTLSGELLEATLSCVSPFGKIVDVREVDITEDTQFDVKALSDGRSYASLSLQALITKQQKFVRGLLGSLTQSLREGIVKPTTLPATYNAQDAEEALTHMQDGNHVGKVVLTLRDARGALQVGTGITRVLGQIRTDSSASYLLAGGLGGIATVVAKQLVENGARRLICMSRNPGSKDTPTIRELESMGCEVVLVKGNLINKEDVFNAVQVAQPLKGVIHAPMLLRDSSFQNMTLEQWNTVADPKVQGAWYLHEATKDMDLDFFVFFSSLSGLNGQPGQANYAGANTYLDSFAQYRNSLGLAASSIDIGAVADMGYAARDDALLQRLMINGYSGIVEQEMTDAFSAAVSYPIDSFTTKGHSFSHQNTFAIGYSSIISPSNPESRAWWKRDIRMAMWHNIREATNDDSGNADKGIGAFLAKVKSDTSLLHAPETVGYLALEIGKQLMNLLLRSDDDLDVTLSVTELGLDSLVGIELRSWWRSTFNVDISVLQLLGLETLEGLAKQAVRQLSTVFGGEEA